MKRSSWLWVTYALLVPAPVSSQVAADAGLGGTYRRGPFEIAFAADGGYRLDQRLRRLAPTRIAPAA